MRQGSRAPLIEPWSPMPARAIVSYDGSDNDHDAVALGRVFWHAGATVDLAYVRHSAELHEGSEAVARAQAQRMLSAGAVLLGAAGAGTHVALNASTPEGLAMLASFLDANLIVFGSEYRTPAGRVRPQPSAQRLLEGGPTAIAVAPAGMRSWTDARLEAIKTIGHDDGAGAEDTAASLAGAVGGTTTGEIEAADLLVFGSRADGPADRLNLPSASLQRIEDATVPILAVTGKPLVF
ncbi:MAG: UspA domain protein [Solirubrobacterales bacterium]|nr:UspA domain protein [Solirubrobacterales bacterium]